MDRLIPTGFALPLFLLLMSVGSPLDLTGATPDPVAAEAAKPRATAAMFRILEENRPWVRVHAAEALIFGGNAPAVRDYFQRHYAVPGGLPDRIGVWRVLAETSGKPERGQWVSQIEGELAEASGPWRSDAVETLCKLASPLPRPWLASARRWAATETGPDLVQYFWAFVVAGEHSAIGKISDALTSTDPGLRAGAAYALRWLQPTDPAVLQRLALAADQEDAGTKAFPYLLSAALRCRADPARLPVWRAQLLLQLLRGKPPARLEAGQALAFAHPTETELAAIGPLLNDADADSAVGAAWAIFGARS